MKDLLKGVIKIHFIGIGGSGMLPIVEILNSKGYEITGSDNNESDVVRRVRNLGIKVNMNQTKRNIKDQDLIIYTAAILKDNEELKAAKKSGIKTIERNDFLEYFTEKFENCISVCGTHGKTTTTSMLTQIFIESGKSPNAIIGGKLKLIDSYSCLGSSNILVCEACEFQDHFLKLFPDTAIVLNIDDDHLEYFKTVENLKNSFKKFCEKTTNLIIYNGDDENTKDVVKNINKRNISFGFGKENNYYAKNIIQKKGPSLAFDIFKEGKAIIEDVEIFVVGMHNVLNALAASIAALENGVSKKDIKKSLKNFKGAGRRFEVVGHVNGITVMDDYAHHPSEILATLKALKSCGFKKIWAVHQPFTFSRTIRLKNDFKNALSLADEVIITEILGSREVNKTGFSGKDLADLIPGGLYIKEQEDVKDYILKNAKEGEVVITMGCGDIYKSAKMIVFGKY